MDHRGLSDSSFHANVLMRKKQQKRNLTSYMLWFVDCLFLYYSDLLPGNHTKLGMLRNRKGQRTVRKQLFG